ncbi:MAG TPA: hypothetical protein VN823_07845 [Stellaceae bacterium]|nr:hypothetical protein [Stellaceae bacterium]
MKGDPQSESTARPAWTYSVPPPETLSALWVLEILASLSIPIAGVAILATAIALGWIPVD